MQPTIIGIIGCGNISDAYLRGAARSRLVRVKSVGDIRADAAAAKAREYGVAAMTVDALLADPPRRPGHGRRLFGNEGLA
jgi:predicted dehydrogenase